MNARQVGLWTSIAGVFLWAWVAPGQQPRRIDDAALEAAMRDPALGHYRPWIEDVRKEKPYQLEDRVEQFGDVSQGGYAREPAIRERRAVKAFARRLPVELAVEPMVVVVAGVGGDGHLGRGEVGRVGRGPATGRLRHGRASRRQIRLGRLDLVGQPGLGVARGREIAWVD